MERLATSRLLKLGLTFPVAALVIWLAIRAVAAALPTAEFMPHGYCLLWNPAILRLQVISDGIIGLTYHCIPVALIYLWLRRRDLPFHWLFLMFGAFIVSCGTTLGKAAAP